MRRFPIADWPLAISNLKFAMAGGQFAISIGVLP
jgi:hypothetical protein